MNRAGLADELVEPLAGHGAGARLVGIGAVIVAGRLAVDRDAEAHRLAVGARPQHQMQVAGMEAEGDLAGCRVECCLLGRAGPVAGQRPLVQRERLRCLVVMWLVLGRTARLDEVCGALIADIGLGRADIGIVGSELGAACR